jgi:SAM-dependent methyltransferase
MLNRIRALTNVNIWPPIDYELSDVAAKGYLAGRVLNAGSGWRDLSHLVDGTLVNQDLTWPGDTRQNVDIFSPIHAIPVEDGAFDTVLCVAVLEHVINPDECVAEMFRVIKSGGRIIASVPFLQPEHKVPTDYQRYTRDGLEHLFTKNGFEIEELRPFYSVYHTLYWICREWLLLKNTLLYKFLRFALLLPMSWRANRSTTVSDQVASVFRVVARKP